MEGLESRERLVLPSIQGNRIWLTTATDGGRSLRAVAVDRDTSAILKNIEVFHLNVPPAINAKNSHASPTPVIEGNWIYLHFGAFGTACIRQSGEIVWKSCMRSVLANFHLHVADSY